MRASKLSVIAGLVLGASTVASMAYPIAINIIGGYGIWTDSFGGTLLPAGGYVQVWWSSDPSYGQASLGVVDMNEASLADGGESTTYGDYVLWSGNTPADGGWTDPQQLNPPNFTDSDVGSHSISSGHIYMYVYADATPTVGTEGVMTEIYGPNGTVPVVWGDQSAANPPAADELPASGAESDGVLGGRLGFVVVPEPGTMALVGIGALTIAARRRRKTA